MRILLTFLFLALLFPGTQARAEWLRAESANFIVYSEGGERNLRERVVLLEEFDRLLRAITGTVAPPSPNKLHIYLVRGTVELNQIARMGRWVGGFYRAAPDGILAVADERRNDGYFRDDVLLHEYAHHFMMQYYPAPYPAWYVEGFAEYVATARIEADRIEYGNYNYARATWLADRSGWIPADELLFGDRSRQSADHFYAQSWLLVHYLMAEDERRAAFVRFMQATTRGEDPRQAFTTAFGMNPDALDEALRDYARRIAYHRLDRSANDVAPAVSIAPLPSGNLDLPVIEAALRRGLDEALRADLLRRARAAGEHGDAHARRLQAHAEMLYGDPGVADRLLDALLAVTPQDAEALYLKGLRHLLAGRADASVRAEQNRLARGYFVRAHRVDPNHYQTLFRFAEATVGDEQFLSENTQNVLLLASQLAPQVNEIRLAAGHLMLLRGQFEPAEAILQPIVNSLHEPGEAQRARDLLALARARERPTDEDVFRTAPKDEPAKADAR